ncbi:hypothetical protein H5410_003887 [Solanum commersonii]|uniref:Uncharacterized protein n=1 Tax=Solanum commersonii TaxID=4109 RepID=A0A9J6B6E1_SOLCO|nr:hypothetical protein H5410_003887 [Solanum commersonii]
MTREERITAMENQKVLNGRVFNPDILTKFGMLNLFYVVSIQGWNHLFEPPIPYLHEPEVREFFYKMELLESGGIPTTVRNVETCLDEEILGIILGIPVEGIQTIEGCKPSSDFTKLATKRGDVKNTGLPKRKYSISNTKYIPYQKMPLIRVELKSWLLIFPSELVLKHLNLSKDVTK